MSTFGAIASMFTNPSPDSQDDPGTIYLTEPELDKLLSEAYAEGRADQLEEMKEKTT